MKLNLDLILEPIRILLITFCSMFLGAMLGVIVLPTFVKYGGAPDVGYSFVLALLMISVLVVVVRAVGLGLKDLYNKDH